MRSPRVSSNRTKYIHFIAVYDNMIEEFIVVIINNSAEDNLMTHLKFSNKA